MAKHLLKYIIAILFAGMAFLALHAEAPSRNTAGALLASSADADTASPHGEALPRPMAKK